MNRTTEHVLQFFLAELGTDGSIDGSHRLARPAFAMHRTTRRASHVDFKFELFPLHSPLLRHHC
jgi:hypothetical protein